MKKLILALPVTNRALLKTVIDLLRLLLHHRHRNKLTTNELCTEFGPIFLGLNANSNANDILSSIEVVRTLIVQNLYLLGVLYKLIPKFLSILTLTYLDGFRTF